MENIDFILILSTALLASMGHCIGMCGGIVVAYTSTKIDPKSNYVRQTTSHLSYNFGRVLTYAILGAIFGGIGQVIAFTPMTKGILFLVTGILMILASLSLVGNIKFLNSTQWSISKYDWYQNAFKKLITSKSYGSFFLLGMLNGIIPCGLVYSFAIFAASTSSPLAGALVMATFGLATIPTLFFLGFFTKFLQKSSLRASMMKIAALLVMAYGFMTLYKSYSYLIHPEKMQAEIEKMHNKSSNKTHEKGTEKGKIHTMKCEVGKCG